MTTLRTYNFEDGTTQGVEAQLYGVLVASTVAATTSQKYEGAYALRHTASTAGDIEMQVRSADRVVVTPGTKITLTLYAREGSAQRGHYVGGNFFDSGGAYISTVGTYYNPGSISQTSWTQLVALDNLEVPGNAARFAFVATSDNAASGNYTDYDLVTLESFEATAVRPPLYESFNKADGLPLGPNLTWTQEFANRQSNMFEIRGGQVTHLTDSASTIARVEDSTPPANQSAELTINALPSTTSSGVRREFGVMCRVDNATPVTGSTNTYYSYAIAHGGTYSVWKRVNNTLTDLTADAGLPGGLGTLPGQMKLVVEGSKVTAYWRGSQVFTVTDTSIAGGKIAMWGVDGGGVSRAEDFGGGALTKSLTLTGDVTPRATVTKTLGRTFTGAVIMGGGLTAIRAVVRIFTASITASGVFTRLFDGIFIGSVQAGGALVKTPVKRLGGSMRPTSAHIRALVRNFAGSLAAQGALATTFLGRVLGVAGTVTMKIVAAGEARIRFRRR